VSRLLTISELYSLLLHDDTKPLIASVASSKNSGPIAMPIATQESVIWMPALSPKTTNNTRQVNVPSPIMHAMESFARDSGITESDAWADAAQAWLIQRQRDKEELESPNGRELAQVVTQIWSRIDEQLKDIRKE
jgi:hypothetical protein